MKQFNKEFNEEDLMELGLSDYKTYMERDDDRSYEVADKWERIIYVNDRVFSYINNHWLEFLFEKDISTLWSRFEPINQEVPIAYYKCDKLEVNGFTVDSVIKYDKKPLEVLMEVLE